MNRAWDDRPGLACVPHPSASRVASLAPAALLVLLAACSGATGTVEVSVSGEEAAVQGFPVGDIAFVDGWSVTFETVTASIGGLSLRTSDGEVSPGEVDHILVDLHQGDRMAYRLEGVGARRWDDVRYDLLPATDSAVDLGTVDPAVRAEMIEEGYSLYVVATAQKGDVTRTLRWGFAQHVRQSRCVGGDGTDGVVVPGGAVVEAQLTLHLDHLFFDDLALDEAEMRFDAMSAVADASGEVTFEGLATQRLADLRDETGAPLLDDEGAPVVYDPGAEALDPPTLLQMMLAASTTIGHFNGEGHCDYEVVAP